MHGELRHSRRAQHSGLGSPGSLGQFQCANALLPSALHIRVKVQVGNRCAHPPSLIAGWAMLSHQQGDSCGMLGDATTAGNWLRGDSLDEADLIE